MKYLAPAKRLAIALLLLSFGCGSDEPDPDDQNKTQNSSNVSQNNDNSTNVPFVCGGIDGWSSEECADGEFCLLSSASNGEFSRCVPLPAACSEGTPSCDCATIEEFSAESFGDPCDDDNGKAVAFNPTTCSSENGRVTVSCRYYEVLVDP